MIRARTRVRKRSARRQGLRPGADIGALFHDLLQALFDPYRPELHYMRGPGPRWRAKHDCCAPADAPALPTPALRGVCRSNCDLIAAILNPNRIFSATPTHESEITGKFVLVFNKFAGTIVRKGDAPRDGDGANGEPALLAPDGVHGKTNSRRREEEPGAKRIGRPRRIRADFGTRPVRSVSARTLLYARAGPQMARQTRPDGRCLSCDAGARACAREALIARQRAEVLG